MAKREIQVTKRDGSKEPYSVEKIQRQIEYACEGISDVSPSMIELSMDLELYDGIKTADIDQIALNAAINLIASEEGDTNYQYVAGRLQNSMLRKEVYGQFEPWPLLKIVERGVERGLYSADLLTWYTKEEWDLMDSFLDHKRDETMSIAAMRQFVDKYLVRNRATGEYIETPQVRYMIAAATDMHAETEMRMKKVHDYYRASSTGDFTLATPVLSGLGTPTKQFSSCVLIKVGDSMDSIFASGEMMAKYAAKRAGIGLEVGRIRPVGSPIRSGEAIATGLIPFIQKWVRDLKCVSQGAVRGSAATLTYPMWHYEFEDLIVLKNNQGTEENRVRQLDYSVVTCKMFWRRLKEKGKITFFDPSEVPDLYEAYYTNIKLFEELYVKYENDPKIRLKRQLDAIDAFRLLLGERTDTGRIYIVFIDNVIAQGPIDSELHPIYQSNLCQEILIPTKSFERIEDEDGRIALCTLGSMNWGKFKKPEDLRKPIHLLVRSLDNILNYQDFLSPQSLAANEDFRPLGIGITNLATWHAKRGLKYGSKEALDLQALWAEHQAYYLLEATVQLAKERGPCKLWKDTSYAKGIPPHRLRAKGFSELTDWQETLDWDSLLEEAKTYGVRNALLSAIAPVESSSVVLDSTNGIEKLLKLIATKESKGGSLVQVAPEYKRLKDKFQLQWDQEGDCVDYLKTACLHAAFTDQSISTNTYYNPKDYDGEVPFQLVVKNLMLAQKWGAKTVYYSVVNKTGIKDILKEDGVAVVNDVQPVVQYEDEDCEACKL